MKCNIRSAAKAHIVEKKLAATDPFNGLLYLIDSESNMMSELQRMRNRYAFRYGMEPSDLPGLPFIVREPSQARDMRNPSRISGKQWVTENGAFFDLVQKREDQRESEPESKSAQVDLAKDELISSMKSFAEDLGISIEKVLELRGHNDEVLAGEALTDFVNSSIQYLQGKDKYIPEELTHFWTMVLKETKDPLYTSMYERISEQPEYAQVVEEYGEVEGYTEDRLKDEAIAHVMLNRMKDEKLQDRNTRWWNRALLKLKQIFEFDPYTKASYRLFTDNLKKYRTVVSEASDPFMFRAIGDSSRNAIRDKIVKEHGNLKLVEFKREFLEGKVQNLDILENTEGIIARYVHVDNPDVPIEFRATDNSTIEFVRSLGGVEKMQKLRASKRVKMASETGSTLHTVGQTLLQKLGNGNSRIDVIDLHGIDTSKSYEAYAADSPLTLPMYNEFKKEMSDLLSYVVSVQDEIDAERNDGVKSKVELLTEVRVSDKKTKTAGTIDIMFVFSDGSVGVYDFKFISPKDSDLVKKVGSNKQIISNPFIGSRMPSFESQLSFYAKALRQEYGVRNVRLTRIIPGHIDFKWDKGEPVGVNVFNMGSDSNAFLAHIPVAHELTDLNEVNIKLQSMYDRLIELKSKQQNAKILKETEMINKAISAILLNTDLTNLLESIESSIKLINKGLAITDPEHADFIEYDDLFHHLQVMLLFKDLESTTLKNLLKLAKTDPKKAEVAKKNLDAMSTMVNLVITSLTDKLKSIAQQESGYSLMAAAPSPGFLDKFIPMDEIDNPIFKEVKDLMNMANSNWRKKLEETSQKWETLDTALMEWARTNGKSPNDAYNMFIKDDGKKLRLIQMYSPDFWKEIEARTGTEEENKDEILKNILWMKENFQIKEGVREEYDENKKHAVARLKLRFSDNEEAYKASVTNWVKKNNVWGENSAWVSDRYWQYLELKPEKAKEKWSSEYATFNQVGNEALLNYYTGWRTQIKEFNKLLDNVHLSPDMIGSVRSGIVENFINGNRGLDPIMEILYEQFEVMSEEDDTSGGNPTKKVPLPFVNPLRNKQGEYDSSLTSRNLTRSMYLLAGSIYNYSEKSEIESRVLFLRHALTTPELAGRERVKDRKSGQINTVDISPDTISLFDALMNHGMYGHSYSEKDFEVFGHSGQKMISALRKYYTFSKLSFPIRIAIPTAIAAGIFTRVSGMGGVQYNNDHLYEAEKLWANDHERYMAIAEFFQVYAEGNNSLKARRMYGNKASVILDSSNLMEPLGMADRMIHRKIAVAMAYNHGLDKDGNIKRMSQLPEGSKNLIDSLEVKDGKVASEISNVAFNDFRHRSKKMAKDIVGESNEENPIAVNTTVAGRLLMVFKSWLPGATSVRWGARRYDTILDEVREGRFMGMIRSMGLKGSLDAMEEKNWWEFTTLSLKMIGSAMTHFTMLQNYRISKASMDKLEAKGKLTPERKADFERRRAAVEAEYNDFINGHYDKDRIKEKINVEDYITMRENSHRRTMAEARTNLVLVLLAMLFGMKGDDDKRLYTKNYATRRLMDIFSKIILETTFFMNPLEAAKLNRSAIPLIGLVTDAQKLVLSVLEASGETMGVLKEDPKNDDEAFYRAATFVPGGTQLRKVFEIAPQDKKVNF